jgi:hypothetical protein
MRERETERGGERKKSRGGREKREKRRTSKSVFL